MSLECLKVAGMRINCCGENNDCLSYLKDNRVGFEDVDSDSNHPEVFCSVERVGWIFMLSGKMRIEGAGQEIPIQEGEMCILSAGDYVVKRYTACRYLLLKTDSQVKYAAQLVRQVSGKPDSSVGVQKLDLRGPLIDYLDALCLYLADGIHCKHWFELKQQELFLILKACYTLEELSLFLQAFRSQGKEDLREMILKNYLDARNVQGLAKICGYSVGTFKRIFREIFDEPVYQWMLKQKAEELKLRLSGKDVNLKLVIDEFGFSSAAHFTKFCKQWLGKSPSQFMKSQQEQPEL